VKDFGTSQSPKSTRLRDNQYCPGPPCVRAASPHHRKLGAGYAPLPQMARRDFSDAYFVFPLALVPRTTEIQCGLIATGD